MEPLSQEEFENAINRLNRIHITNTLIQEKLLEDAQWQFNRHLTRLKSLVIWQCVKLNLKLRDL